MRKDRRQNAARHLPNHSKQDAQEEGVYPLYHIHVIHAKKHCLKDIGSPEGKDQIKSIKGNSR